MKTSNDLLTDILGVLGQISTKIDAMSNEPSKKGGMGSLGSGMFLGGMLKKGKEKNGISAMADSVEKLNKELDKVNIKKLNTLINTISTYEKIPKENLVAKRVSNISSSAKDLGMALVYTAGGVLGFVTAFGAAKNILGISPFMIPLFIFETFAVLSMSMILISGADAIGEKLAGGILSKSTTLKGFKGAKADRGRNREAIQSAKEMGIALMYIAGGILSFGITAKASSALLGTNGIWESSFTILGVVSLIALSMIVLSTLTGISDRVGGAMLGRKSGKGSTKDAIQNAKDMGIALMTIAGGVFLFSLSILLTSQILGQGKNTLKAVGIVALIIIGMVGVFALLGLAAPLVGPGIAVTKGIGFALAILSLSILVIAGTSALLMKFADTSATKKTGEKRGKFGQLMSGIGAGLGMFGIMVVSMVGLFWAMGFPLVSGPVMLGAISLMAVSLSLLLLCASVKRIQKSIGELGGTDGISILGLNIENLVGTVMHSVIAGIMGSGIDKARKDGTPDGNLSFKEMQQFRRITKVIKMLSKISTSLSKFAQGLRAFQKVGEIFSLEYEYDKDGNPIRPIIGEKVHVTSVAKSIADTFGMFINSLVTNTQKLTRTQARSLKILGKSLTGDRGLISGISQFAVALNTFAQFGKEAKIFVPDYDKDGNPVIGKDGKEKKVGVPITTITQYIIDTFGKFVSAMAAKAPEFEIGGMLGNKMLRFSEALMGKKGGLGREKPGILSAIIDFNDILLRYSEYGANGEIPKLDPKTGEIVGHISTTDVANNMVSSITTFVNSLNKALNNTDLNAASKEIDKKLGAFSDIITQFDKLAKSQEGLDKLANSMGLLATNVGTLVTNMKEFDPDTLQSLTNITAKHAVATKGVTINPNTSSSTESSQVSQQDWNKISDMIAEKLAGKLVGVIPTQMNFRFYDAPEGIVEMEKK